MSPQGTVLSGSGVLLPCCHGLSAKKAEHRPDGVWQSSYWGAQLPSHRTLLRPVSRLGSRQIRTSPVVASTVGQELGKLAVAAVAALPVCWLCLRQFKADTASARKPGIAGAGSNANLTVEVPRPANHTRDLGASRELPVTDLPESSALPGVDALEASFAATAEPFAPVKPSLPCLPSPSPPTIPDLNSKTSISHEEGNDDTQEDGVSSRHMEASHCPLSPGTPDAASKSSSSHGGQEVEGHDDRLSSRYVEAESDIQRRVAHTVSEVALDVDTGSSVQSLQPEISKTKRVEEEEATTSGRPIEGSASPLSDPRSWSTRKDYVAAYKEALHQGRLSECIDVLEKGQEAGKMKAKKVSHQHLLYACKESKDVDTATRFLKLLDKPSLGTYNMVMGVCAEAGDVDRAFSIFSAVERSGLKADCQIYTTLIVACTKSNRTDLAFKVFREMESAKVEPSLQTYGAMIHSCAQARQVAKAFGIYSIILKKKLKPDRAIYNSLISACGRSGALERAFDVMTDMRSDGLVPNVVTMGSLVNACAQAGETDRALEIYEGMKMQEVVPSREVYTSLIHACSKTKNLEKAMEIYNDMKQANAEMDEILFGALMDAAQQAGKVDFAFVLLAEMEQVKVQPSSITYTALVGVCSNAGLTERAQRVYAEMKGRGIKPTPSMFNALMSAYGKEGKLQNALDLLEEMKSLNVTPDEITYATLVAACAKVDEADMAFNIYDDARAGGIPPTKQACVSLVGMCFDRIKKRGAAPLPSYSAGVQAWELATSSAQQQWAYRALRVYRETISAGVKVPIPTLSTLLGCLKLHRTPDLSSFGRPMNRPSDQGDPLAYAAGYGQAGIATFGNKTKVGQGILKDEGAGMYAPQALVLYEEAAAAGIVPQFTYTGPLNLDLTRLPPNAAEVCILAMLKGLKLRRASAPDSRVFSVKLTLKTHLQPCPDRGMEHPIHVCSKSGATVAALLRRLRIYFQGQESSGTITITGSELARWLKPPKPKAAIKTFRPAASNARLAQNIAQQQMAIRMGEVPVYDNEVAWNFEESKGQERRNKQEKWNREGRGRRNRSGEASDSDDPDSWS